MVEMIDIEQIAQSDEAHAMRVNATTAEAATVEAPQTHEKIDLAQVEQDLFDFFSKAADAIPDWVPVVAPYLKAKKSEWAAMAALHGSNLATGEKIKNTPEALQVFVKKFFDGFLHEGRTVLDLLLIFGTGGSGNLAVGAEQVAAQKLGESAGKITLEGLGTKIAKLAAGGESAAIDMVPDLFKGLAQKLAKHPESAQYLLETADVYEAVQKIPGVKALMEKILSEQKWWQKLNGEFKSSEGRANYGKEIFAAVNRVHFTQQPIPA